MTRWLVALLMTMSACSFGGGEGDAVAELVELAARGSSVTYAAIYTYEVSGPLAPAVTTRLEIVQDPTTSIRKIETATPGGDSDPITLRYWQVRTLDGDFVCNTYEEIGEACLPDPSVTGTFGSAQIDVFFDIAADDVTFTSAVKAARTLRIAGEDATCFEAIPTEKPLQGSPPPGFQPESFRMELCYASDGVLLRGQRTIVGDVPDALEDRRVSVVEAVSTSRVVEPRELKLPGPVVDPSDL